MKDVDVGDIYFYDASLCLACRCDGWGCSSHFVAMRERPSVLLFKVCSEEQVVRNADS